MKKRIIVLLIMACIFLSGCVSDGGDSGVEWELEIGGDVDSSFTITFDDILDLESTTIEATIEKTTGSTQTNEWTGISMVYILERAAPHDNVDKVIIEAFDGYTVTLDIEDLEGGLVAYEMDGERLPESEPLRMALPNMWGPAWMRGVNKITFTSTDGKLQIMGEVKAPLLLTPGDLDEFTYSTVSFEGEDYDGVTLTQLFEQARYIFDSTHVAYHNDNGTFEVPIDNVLNNELAIVFTDGDSFGVLMFADDGSQVLENVYAVELKIE